MHYIAGGAEVFLMRTKVQHQRGVDKVVDWTVALLHKGNFPGAVAVVVTGSDSSQIFSRV